MTVTYLRKKYKYAAYVVYMNLPDTSNGHIEFPNMFGPNGTFPLATSISDFSQTLEILLRDISEFASQELDDTVITYIGEGTKARIDGVEIDKIIKNKQAILLLTKNPTVLTEFILSFPQAKILT